MYDTSGRMFDNLVSDFKEIGHYRISFDTEKLHSGIYYYTMNLDNNFIDTKRMVIIR
jgi:hypothetical protein